MRVARSLRGSRRVRAGGGDHRQFRWRPHRAPRIVARRFARRLAKKRWQPAVLTFDPHPATDRRAATRAAVAHHAGGTLRGTGAGRNRIRAGPPVHLASGTLDSGTIRRTSAGQSLSRAARSLSATTSASATARPATSRVLAQLGQRFGFETRVVNPVKWRGRAVSSSEIRQAVEAGKVSARGAAAGPSLCNPRARWFPGTAFGSKQTVPTLNLRTHAQVLPATGVYITRTSDAESEPRWNSITNVGYRPTFADRASEGYERTDHRDFPAGSPLHAARARAHSRGIPAPRARRTQVRDRPRP